MDGGADTEGIGAQGGPPGPQEGPWPAEKGREGFPDSGEAAEAVGGGEETGQYERLLALAEMAIRELSRPRQADLEDLLAGREPRDIAGGGIDGEVAHGAARRQEESLEAEIGDLSDTDANGEDDEGGDSNQANAPATPLEEIISEFGAILGSLRLELDELIRSLGSRWSRPPLAGRLRAILEADLAAGLRKDLRGWRAAVDASLQAPAERASRRRGAGVAAGTRDVSRGGLRGETQESGDAQEGPSEGASP